MGWERIFTLVLIWCFGVAAALAVLAAEKFASFNGDGEIPEREQKAEAIRKKCLELKEMMRDFAQGSVEEEKELQRDFRDWCAENFQENGLR